MNNDLKKAVEVLRAGGIILYPTDTIWGLGCDATNKDAVERIYKIKQRDDSKSMLVLIDNPAKLNSYIDEVPEIAWDLIDVADKPLTIIYPGAKNLADNLIAPDGSIGIRVTNEEFSRSLCQRFRIPVVSTSANISGKPAPGNFSEIDNKIINLVDYVVEYKQDSIQKSAPSGIIKLGKGGEVTVIRE
ncbi:MAG: threonylcarbamoyl-AMP synthase [Chlorobi bacterium]|nr:threonylcarbamoyl-AMP synthase [Chlorobiota bacterium]